MKKTAEERFWEKVQQSDANKCWPWTAATYRDGYGAFMVDHKLTRAHRYSWELHFGPIPDGIQCLHKCDNPPCVNPNHLFLGTPQDNSDDMVKKGRHVGCRKLTPGEVVKIRKMYSEGGHTIYAMAEQFEITPQGIWSAIHKHWNGIVKFRTNSRAMNMPRGSVHKRAKLTEDKVTEMRRLRKNTNMTIGEIANQFSAPIGTVKKAIRGTGWKHVSEPPVPSK